MSSCSLLCIYILLLMKVFRFLETDNSKHDCLTAWRLYVIRPGTGWISIWTSNVYLVG
jgi:hypothetical protein